MTNLEKAELRQLCRAGKTFKQIRAEVDCADTTIKRYMRVFGPTKDSGKVGADSDVPMGQA